MPGILNSLNNAQTRLTRAIIDLQRIIRTIKESQRSGGPNTLLAPISSESNGDHGITFLSPVSDSEAVNAQLKAFEAQLDVFEAQLRERGQWRIPDTTEISGTNSTHTNSRIESSTVFDLADLEEAISLLSTTITSPSPSPPPIKRPSPYTYFSRQKWHWHASWHEFYFFLPTPRHYVFLSEWKFSPSINAWTPVMYHNVGRTIEETSAMLGCWEDWRWDALWKEWCLPLPLERGDAEEEEEGVKRSLYASEWIIEEEGTWVYVDQRGDE